MAEDQSASFGPWHPDLRAGSYYVVEGFRSLQNFTITLKAGLNVLLGSNGSGKTNFIEFLDFITSLVNKNTAAAVSASGGIARVFSQESLKRKIPRVKAKICGLADISPFILNNHSIKRRYFNFEYEVDLRYSKFHSAVYIAHEKVKFKNLHSIDDNIDHNTTVGSLEIHRRNPLPDETPRWIVGTYLKSNATRNPLRHMHLHRMPSPRRKGEKTSAASTAERVNVARADLLGVSPPAGPDESILAARPAFPAMDAVRDALSRSRSFNLNPHIARQPDDISKLPNIDPDGSGLSSTIYHMQQVQKSNQRSLIRGRRFPKDALETIVAWTQIVLPDLQDITATADPHTGKYQVYLHVSSDGGSLRIPLQSTSDGTLKWLAYVCVVVSHGSEYTFEEPENFMHPKMQQFFVSLLRDNINSSDIPTRYVLSTHSETIINQCRPEELILFYFDNGQTRCTRISNVDAVVRQVNETGFGLGYYYALNVLH